MPDSTPDFARDVPLDAAALEAVQEELAGMLEQAGIAGPVRYRVRLVVEELVANLMMHGRFPGAPPPARLAVRLGPGAVLVALDDAAAPFDPRAAPDPARPSLEDDRLGGMGLALVRRMAEICDYRRLPEGWNRTELAFGTGPGTPA